MDDLTIRRTVRMAVNALEGRDPATTNVIPFPVQPRRQAVSEGEEYPDIFVVAFRRIRAARRAGLPVPKIGDLLDAIKAERGKGPVLPGARAKLSRRIHDHYEALKSESDQGPDAA